MSIQIPKGLTVAYSGGTACQLIRDYALSQTSLGKEVRAFGEQLTWRWLLVAV